ncbi:DeoR/GlpR family DNA-binding transcription regulator [Salibacterium halotolerans]|uniref:DNA-binding transcriptional regulator of sugar metabolism, DeoR/GlpR family n=1 Tax=Salibacterium halotolerans TaxID=1884432 RepID=A0A1I5W009_9BACI|nr:DeoR/GlpR family DNA-binding transcription regulator [Salibacterium halotolerans]SFQ13069.1 DNA-binding transcriptional regulator of sugar metabolism, DeoR/GlpR family [Salibacterium halotolerans]
MSLIAEERKQEILGLLEMQKKVRVSDLAEQLNVSAETVRRHLDDLEHQNKLKKVYGGAVPVPADNELPHYERESIHIREKRIIGRLAAEQVLDNDIIVIDEGSTPLQMIPFLTDKKNLTIMTCSIPALNRLIEYVRRAEIDARVLFIGGEVSVDHLRISGPVAESMMDDFYVNKAFIATDGVDINHGITSFDLNKALFTRKLIDQAERTYILADQSKIGSRTYVKMSKMDDVYAIISEKGEPDSWVSSMQDKMTKWLSPDSV